MTSTNHAGVPTSSLFSRMACTLSLGLTLVASPIQAATPLPLITGVTSPAALSTDGTYLYFGSINGLSGTLNRMDLNGANHRTVPIPGGGEVLGITLAADSIYVKHCPLAPPSCNQGYSVQIDRFPKDFTNTTIPTPLITTNDGDLVGVIGNYLYYSYGFCCIGRMPITGGTKETVVSGGYFTRGTVSDDPFIFVSTYAGPVYRLNTLSNEFIEVMPTMPSSADSFLFLDTNNLYRTLSYSPSIYSVPKQGGTAQTLLPGTVGSFGYASNGTSIYGTVGYGGSLFSMPVAGGTQSPLPSPTSATDIVYAANSIFWRTIETASSQGSIYRLTLTQNGWIWPIPDRTRGNISQDFEEFNSVCGRLRQGKKAECKRNAESLANDGSWTYHHTGIDIGTQGQVGMPVIAAYDGTIVLLQRSMPDHPNADHGNGNTIILHHRINGNDIYSQYQHLRQEWTSTDPRIPSETGPAFDAILEANLKAVVDVATVGPPGPGKCTPESKRGTISCTPLPNGDYGVSVKAGDLIGYSGGSGNGVAHAWPAHLHFEIKNFPAVSWNGAEFGYTHALPTVHGYLDPSSFIDGPLTDLPRRIVKVTGPYVKHTGPSREYPQGNPETGKLFIAINDRLSTPGCSHGWVQIVKTVRDVSDTTNVSSTQASTNYFPKADLINLESGFEPDAWMCKGHDYRLDSPPGAADVANVKEFRSGDVNNDGTVDQIDVDTIWRNIFIWEPNAKGKLKKCRKSVEVGIDSTDVSDLNGDGFLNWADVELAQRLCSPNCSLPVPNNACPPSPPSGPPPVL